MAAPHSVHGNVWLNATVQPGTFSEIIDISDAYYLALLIVSSVAPALLKAWYSQNGTDFYEGMASEDTFPNQTVVNPTTFQFRSGAKYVRLFYHGSGAAVITATIAGKPFAGRFPPV